MTADSLGRANYAAGSTNLESRAAIWSYADRSSPTSLSGLGWFCDLVDWEDVELCGDIGCGSGRYLETLASRSRTVVGVDLSLGMLTEVAEWSTTPLVVGDVCELPVADGVFDRLLAAWMLYHAGDARLACRELRRVLKHGGVLIAVTNAASHTGELDDLWDAAMLDLIGSRRSRPRLPVNGFTFDTAADMLSGEFDSVEMTIRRTRLRVPRPEPVITYLSSLRDYMDTDLSEVGLTFDDVVPALTTVVHREMDESGAFEITGLTAAVICR